MQQDRFDVLLETQRDYFRTGATLPVSFRVEMLKKLPPPWPGMKRRSPGR